MKYSLWLIPPSPVRQHTRTIIRHLAERSNNNSNNDRSSISTTTTTGEKEEEEENKKGRGGVSSASSSPAFEPHITIIGGIDLPNDDDNQDDPRILCQTLEMALKGKFPNGIECEMEQDESHNNNNNNMMMIVRDDREPFQVQWNQALVAILHETESLIHLVDASREALSSLLTLSSSSSPITTSNSSTNTTTTTTTTNPSSSSRPSSQPKPKRFSSPGDGFVVNNNKPHLSLFYGTHNIPKLQNLDIPSVYRATELALWKTDPSTLDGVRHWEEVGRIQLL